jgi:RNA polymerase sigma-70 factor (ECF subfamily)
MLLAVARRDARTDGDGALVPLPAQDRTRWDAALVAEGRELVRACLRRGRPGPYQIQAAIQAVHTDEPTDWAQVVALYDQLLALAPTPVAALNRAVAVAEVDGPAAALALVEPLPLERLHVYHAVRADLLRRLGRTAGAAAAYAAAAERTDNAAERAFLEARRAELG